MTDVAATMPSVAQLQQQLRIGFIGLGKMGSAMARSLVTAGYAVTVYNRTYDATAALTSCGATAVRSALELAGVDVLFSMTANDAALEACVVHSGLLAAMAAAHRARHDDSDDRNNSSSSSTTTSVATAAADTRATATAAAEQQPGLLTRPVHVSCGTLSVAFVRAQAALHAVHDVDYVSMPVLGRPDAAAARALFLLYSGNASLLRVLRPLVVPTLGCSLHICRTSSSDDGDDNDDDEAEVAAAAAVVKIACNAVLFNATEALAEACALVRAHGVAPADFTALLSQTMFDCRAYRDYGARIAARAYVPAGASLAGVGLKDCKLALDAGEAACVPLPFTSVLRDKYLQAMAHGMSHWDACAIAVVAEQQAGLATTTTTTMTTPHEKQPHDDGGDDKAAST